MLTLIKRAQTPAKQFAPHRHPRCDVTTTHSRTMSCLTNLCTNCQSIQRIHARGTRRQSPSLVVLFAPLENVRPLKYRLGHETPRGRGPLGRAKSRRFLDLRFFNDTVPRVGIGNHRNSEEQGGGFDFCTPSLSR